METREIRKSLTNGLSEAKRRGFSRRSVLPLPALSGRLHRSEYLERPAR
jgi:hypothetical protein